MEPAPRNTYDNVSSTSDSGGDPRHSLMLTDIQSRLSAAPTAS